MSRHDDLEQASGAWTKGEVTEPSGTRDDEPTAEVDLGNGRKLRLNLPQLPQWVWGIIAMTAGGSGTAVGWFASQDWLGLHAQRELAEVRCDLRLAQCGCPVPPRLPEVAP
jgi:hypothetical protein